MIDYLSKKFALSKKGAKDLVKACISCTISYLILAMPIGLLYLLVNDLLNRTELHTIAYCIGIPVALILIFIAHYIQYDLTFLNTYKESAVRRINLAERLRKLPLSYFGKKDLSDLTTTLMTDCTNIEKVFSHYIPEFIGSIVSTTIVSIGLFFFDWRMALASVWCIPLAFIIAFSARRIEQKVQRRNKKDKLECSDGIQEYLETIRDLKSNNSKESYLSEIDKKMLNVEKSTILNELACGVFVTTGQMLLKLGIATTVIVGGTLIVTGQIELLTFLLFLIVVSRLYDPLNGTLINLSAINTSMTQIERMNEINDYPIQEGKSKFNPINYDISFENVKFAYNKEETVLENVSFVAKQGEVTALIGPSGSGKSTISKLASRFWDIDSGKIKLGNYDISQIEPETLLSCYSIVFQDVTLFNSSILDNIRIGKKDATDEEVMRAAREARCEEFINKLPDGYNTMIGENGSHLSGGERQRISIARAILKDAPIILLDEATASLDTENETKIQEALSRLVRNKTVLIIAHRMRTVTNADKIIVLKDGVVAEQGKPGELLKRNGIFANMVQKQTESSVWILV